jgi:hypothetical protein
MLVSVCRFGLYNTPFEPELFDIEPPIPAKFSSVPITYATVVSGETGGGTMVTGAGISAGPPGFGLASDLDLRELLGIGGRSTFVCRESIVVILWVVMPFKYHLDLMFLKDSAFESLNVDHICQFLV